MHQNNLQRAISCVTDAVLTINDMAAVNTPQPTRALTISFKNDDPVRLRSRQPLAITIFQRLRVELDNGFSRRSWQVAVTDYDYILRVPDGQEIVAYQWVSTGFSRITHPHLHIGRGATGNVTTFGPRGLHRIHFPTRHITLEDVLRLAITEFEVEPRRPDWEHILGGS